MGNAGANFRQAFVRRRTNTGTTICIVLLCIFAISYGIAAPIHNKPAAERIQPSVQPGVDAVEAGCTLAEGFDSVDTLVANGWFMQNNSVPAGSTGWSQGNPAIFT